nr:hypothetical protein [Salmonella enterica subsp. enterica serovar Weltevreden]
MLLPNLGFGRKRNYSSFDVFIIPANAGITRIYLTFPKKGVWGATEQ